MARSLLDKFKSAKGPKEDSEGLQHPAEGRRFEVARPKEAPTKLSDKDWYAIHRLWRSSLFNPYYLKNEFRAKKAAEMLEYEHGFQRFLTQFRDLCEKRQHESFKSWKESDTIESWIMPVMQALGWWDTGTDPCVREASLSAGDGRTFFLDRLFVQKASLKKHIQENEGAKQLEYARQYGIMALEAKYWDRFEKYSKGEIGNKEDKARSDIGGKDTPSALSPSGQILAYLKLLKNEDPPRNFYGIVTDGRTWRLHHVNYPEGMLYEFDLGGLMYHLKASRGEVSKSFQEEPKLFDWYVEAARYFYYFFSKETLFKDNEPTFVDSILRLRQKYVEDAEDDLRDRFMDAMKFACNGLKRAADNSGIKLDLNQIRGLAESHLFSFLFIKSCEARGVLPLYTNYKERSLTFLVERLRQFDPSLSDEDNEDPVLKRAFGEKYENKNFDLYDQVLRLTKMVETGSAPDMDFVITGFGESVFSNEEKKLREKLKFTNIEMAKILFALGYLYEDSVWKQIPYIIFSARQLGSIYESLLEYKIDVDKDQDLEFLNKKWRPLSQKTRDKLTRNEQVKQPVALKGELFFTPDNSERKASGTYYTPDFVANYMVSRCLGPLIRGLGPKELLKVRVCDPAMGSGHYLNEVLTEISESYQKALYSSGGVETLTTEEAKRKVLDSCIFGVDKNERAVKLARMGLWLETARAGEKLDPLTDQLIRANSLTEEGLAGTDFYKTWTQGFDLVIGNPPYLGEKGNKDVFRSHREGHPFLMETYERKMDYFYWFIVKGISLLHTEGLLSFITTNYWVTADGAATLKSFMQKNGQLLEYVDFLDSVIFKDASGQCNSLFVFKKGGDWGVGNVERYQATPKFESNPSIFEDKTLRDPSFFRHSSPVRIEVCPNDGNWTLGERQSEGKKGSSKKGKGLPLPVFDKMLGKDAVCRSVETGADRVTNSLMEMAVKKNFLRKKKDEFFLPDGQPADFEPGEGIFVLDYEKAASLTSDKDVLKQFYKNSDLGFYCVDNSSFEGLLYVHSETDIDKYKKVKNHLSRFRPLLASREQANNDDSNWFWIRGPKKDKIFGRTTIVCPYRSLVPKFAISIDEVYGAGDVYHVKEFFGYDPLVMLGYLNSSFVARWFAKNGKRKGKMYELYQTPLSQVPVPLYSKEEASSVLAEVKKIHESVQRMKKEKGETNTKQLLDELALGRKLPTKQDSPHLKTILECISRIDAVTDKVMMGKRNG